jgi:hypothetical protein
VEVPKPFEVRLLVPILFGDLAGGTRRRIVSHEVLWLLRRRWDGQETHDRQTRRKLPDRAKATLKRRAERFQEILHFNSLETKKPKVTAPVETPAEHWLALAMQLFCICLAPK